MFVYPSLYEGFGLPPLEAMAWGIPVIFVGVVAGRKPARGSRADSARRHRRGVPGDGTPGSGSGLA